MRTLEQQIVLPPALLADVEAANTEAVAETARLRQEAELKLAQVNEFAECVKDTYALMPAPLQKEEGSDNLYAFLPTAWIRHWLRRSGELAGPNEAEAAIGTASQEVLRATSSSEPVVIDDDDENFSGGGGSKPANCTLTAETAVAAAAAASAKETNVEAAGVDAYSAASIGTIDCTSLLCPHGRFFFVCVCLHPTNLLSTTRMLMRCIYSFHTCTDACPCCKQAHVSHMKI
jgi:hypothetical protein